MIASLWNAMAANPIESLVIGGVLWLVVAAGLSERHVRLTAGGASKVHLPPPHEASDVPAAEPAKPRPVSTKTVVREPDAIPPGEFEVGGKSKNRALYIRLANCKADPKTDYAISATAMQWYSPGLEQGRGGFVPDQWFARLQGSKLLPHPGGNRRELHHGSPQLFPLLPDPGKDKWRFVLGGQAVALRETVWRIFLQLHWGKRVYPMLAEIELNTVQGGKVATMKLYQGADVARHVTAAPYA